MTDNLVLTLLLLVPIYLCIGCVVLAVLFEAKLVEFKNDIVHAVYYIMWPIFVSMLILWTVYCKIFKPRDQS